MCGNATNKMTSGVATLRVHQPEMRLYACALSASPEREFDSERLHKINILEEKIKQVILIYIAGTDDDL